MKSGNFFNNEQKKVKAKIMNELFDCVMSNLQENSDLFQKPQHIMDLVGSILLMFSRDLLIHTICSLRIEHDYEKVLTLLCDEIKKQVIEKMRGTLN